ncbi:MAG: NAD-dependent epimerase/dehydratase family protein [Polyangiaceae bacterium]|nr:NAD-dependent epimerase/dehydratase family protein [Polyangiaceae bacterium]
MMPMPSPVAVTGASGFIGSWIVKLLLDEGVAVHATVRNRSQKDKVGHLEELGAKSSGNLKLFEADLCDPSGFLPVFASCKVVMHVASPFRVQGVKEPERELIEPAVSGTRSVLRAVNDCPSVERVVLTSSVAAVHGDSSDHAGQPLDESLWNEAASPSYQPYAYSKMLAEREAWRIAGEQNRWRLVTINPSFVVGPSLSARVDGTSVDLMLQFVDGRAQAGLPDLRLGVVDVRDVARAHLLAASVPDAEGRHIVSNQVLSFPEIAALLREIYDGRYPIPTRTVPKPLVYLIGPFLGFSWRYVHRNIGVPIAIDNSKSQKALGLSYLPIRQSLEDSIDQLDRMGLINRRR